MWNIWIVCLLLNLLRKIRSMKKLGGTICCECRIVIGAKDHGEYYRMNGFEFCSLQCYYDHVKIAPKVQKVVAKKKKGNKK
jgi:hypothetical protein